MLRSAPLNYVTIYNGSQNQLSLKCKIRRWKVICLKKPALFTNLIVLYIISGVSIVWTQVGIQYQNRGNRYEGIRPKPVSGDDIELISARVNYQEESRQLPNLFKLKLYLQQQVKVYVIVRELDYKRYYWMDKNSTSGTLEGRFR